MPTQRSIVWITGYAFLIALEQYLELFASAYQKFKKGDQTRLSLLERQAEWCFREIPRQDNPMVCTQLFVIVR